MSACPPVSQSRSFFLLARHSMRLGARTRVSREKIRKTGLWGETCLMLSWCFLLARPGPGVGPGSVRAVIWVMEGRPGHCTTRGNIHKITPQKMRILGRKFFLKKLCINMINKCPRAPKIIQKCPVSAPSQCCMHVTLHHSPHTIRPRYSGLEQRSEHFWLFEIH